MGPYASTAVLEMLQANAGTAESTEPVKASAADLALAERVSRLLTQIVWLKYEKSLRGKGRASALARPLSTRVFNSLCRKRAELFSSTFDLVRSCRPSIEPMAALSFIERLLIPEAAELFAGMGRPGRKKKKKSLFERAMASQITTKPSGRPRAIAPRDERLWAVVVTGALMRLYWNRKIALGYTANKGPLEACTVLMRDPDLKGSAEERLRQAIPITDALRYLADKQHPVDRAVGGSVSAKAKRFSRVFNREGQLIPDQIRSGG